MSAKTVYGVDGAEWGAMNAATLDFLKSKGIAAIRLVMYINDWNNNIVNPVTGDIIKVKFPQISQMCHMRGMKLIIATFGTQWNPPEGWDQMKLNAINNVGGAGDNWINTYADVVRQVQPDAIEPMNEPPQAIDYPTYKAWCVKAITAWRTIAPNITIMAMSIPYWDLTAVTKDPLPFKNVVYEMHYYYSYDNSNPSTWGYVDQTQLDYWNGNLVAAKTELYNYLDLNFGIKAAQQAGLSVMFGESGTNYLNPNYLQFMQDFISYAQQRKVSYLIDHIYRTRTETPNGLLNTISPDSFNDLGMVFVNAINIANQPNAWVVLGSVGLATGAALLIGYAIVKS